MEGSLLRAAPVTPLESSPSREGEVTAGHALLAALHLSLAVLRRDAAVEHDRGAVVVLRTLKVVVDVQGLARGDRDLAHLALQVAVLAAGLLARDAALSVGLFVIEGLAVCDPLAFCVACSNT